MWEKTEKKIHTLYVLSQFKKSQTINSIAQKHSTMSTYTQTSKYDKKQKLGSLSSSSSSESLSDLENKTFTKTKTTTQTQKGLAGSANFGSDSVSSLSTSEKKSLTKAENYKSKEKTIEFEGERIALDSDVKVKKVF